MKRVKVEKGKFYYEVNGMLVCDKHVGHSARHTGICLDGMPLQEVSDEDVIWFRQESPGVAIQCESCGKEMR